MPGTPGVGPGLLPGERTLMGVARRPAWRHPGGSVTLAFSAKRHPDHGQDDENLSKG